MISQQKRNRFNTSDRKKALVLGPEKPSRVPLIIALVIAVLVGGGGYMWIFGTGPSNTTAAVEQHETAEARFKHPVSLFDQGIARHFEYTDGDATIRYFIIKSADGVIRAAFDACDVCWRAGKGYFQEGTFMVCRNCGQKFESEKINEVKGGCNPSPLRRTIEGNHVVINVADILEGRGYFDFSGGA
mgnify:CR=1 FL=1